MDVKDLRTESALSERNNDGSKYTQGGIAPQCSRSKSYQDIGSNSLAKTESTPVRPCAVIGPDRVVPQPASTDAFLKKGPADPWPSPDSVYRRPPEYPHKILNNQNPSRNISPRQTFQENMQRIMVPPTYNAVRHSDEANFSHIQDRNVVITKSVKPNLAPEAKYCDVPYPVNALANEPKNIRDTEMYVPSVNSTLTRTAPHGWHPGSVNVRPSRTFGAHELYQYPQYQSCAGQRPPVIPMTRPHRTIQDEAYPYPDHYFQNASARFTPYPPVKERHQQPRYEYIGNYPTQFHPQSALQPHKYDISKPGQPHPYPVYPHLKYLDNRVPDPTMEAYQRSSNQQPHYNMQFRNQVIHPTYAPVAGSSSQNKVHPYPPDGSVKSMASNKLPYDSNNKMFIDYENSRNKTYPIADSYFVNEMGRVHSVKNQMVMPNYAPIGVHSIPSQPYYRKDNSQMKAFEYMPHYRNFEPSMNNNTMMRHAPLFSPNTLATSPTDSSTSVDTSQTHGTSQEDCGYASQSSTTSVRSVDSGMYRLPHEYYKRYDFRYGSIVGNSPLHSLTKPNLNSNSGNPKEKQSKIDVRQFFQMWKDGEEDNAENNNSKEIVIETGSSDTSSYSKHVSNQDQLYVLGLVNVPSEELGKYEHIQKISKLPENIKGYNNLELLSQFEEAIESSNTNSFKSIPKEYQRSFKINSPKQLFETLPRPVSPLDVESKISQSVIHKEVGCNFEIRPCSPQMLNVEVAAPANNVLGERAIEKVSNPLSKIVKSPKPMKPDENINCHPKNRQEKAFDINDNPSCKMIKSPYTTNNMESVKPNYSLQDLEINSGVCLASLPRLDNEIELNFAEVNQQFINANKKDDNNSIKACLRSNLKEDSDLSENKLFKADLEKSENTSLGDESEKIFTKLSKYRKLKINPVDHSEKSSLPMAVRTDSVIIKNPENIKNIEDKLLENSLNVPMNLSSQSSVCHDLPDKLSVIEDHDVDKALDFSLNKSGNDELMKSLTINLPRLSCDSCTDPSESSNTVTNLNDNYISNSKITGLNMKSELIKDICIDNNQDSTMDVEANIEETINSINAKNYTHSSDVVNACMDSLIAGESKSPGNKYLNCDTDHINTNNITELSETLQTCKDSEDVSSEKQTWAKKSDKHDDTIASNNILYEENPTEDFTNCSNLVSPHKEIVSKYVESDEIMNLFETESNVDNLVNRNKCSQNKDDFENDEISASLEKMFQDSNDDTVFSGRDNSLSDLSVSTSTHILGYHQSKELYSPWIQKLLTHSEGLCSKIDNESIQKDCIKDFSKNEEYLNDSKISTDSMLEIEQSQKKEIDQATEVIGPLHYIEKNIFNGKTSEEIFANAEFKTQTESNTIRHQPDVVTDTIKEINVCANINEIKSEELRLLQKITETSNAPQSCSSKVLAENSPNESITNDTHQTNPELDIGHVECPKITNLEDSKQETLQVSKPVEDQINDKTWIGLSAGNVENKIKSALNETNNAQEAPLLCDGRKYISEPENGIQKDGKINNFHTLSSFISTNSTEDQNEVEKTEKSLTQDINTNISTDVITEMLDCRKNIVSQFDNTIQEDLIEPNLESLSNIIFDNSINVSDNSIGHQSEENQSEECFMAEVIKNPDSGACNTLETFDSNNVVCKNDKIAQKGLNNAHLNTLSNGVNDISIEQKPKEIQTGKCLTETCDGQERNDNIGQETPNIPNLESLSDNNFDICAGHQTEGKKSNECIEEIMKNDDGVTVETSHILNSDNVICENDNANLLSQDELPNPNHERLSKKYSNNTTAHQTCVTLETRNNSNFDNKAQKDFPEILSHSVSDSCTNQKTEGIQNGSDLIEHFTKILNRDDILDSSLTDCKVDNLSGLDLNDSNGEKLSNRVVGDCIENQMQSDRNVDNPSSLDFNNPNVEKLSNGVTDTCIGNQMQTDHNVDNPTGLDLNDPNVEKLSNGVVDNCIEYQMQSNRNVDNPSSLDFNNPNVEKLSNGVTDTCIGNQMQTDHNVDNPTGLDLNDPNVEKLSNGVVDNCIENQMQSDRNVDNPTGLDLYDPDVEQLSVKVVDNCIENQIQDKESRQNAFKNTKITDTNSNTVVSKVCDDSQNSYKRDIIIQDSNHSNQLHYILKNLTNCISEQSPNKEENSSSIEISTKTDDEVLMPIEECENNLKSTRCEDVENQQDQLNENNASNSNEQDVSTHESLKRRSPLKRSFSESALDRYNNKDTTDRPIMDPTPLIWPAKRQKLFEFEHSEQHQLDESICNLIHSNRRNSVSSFYNEENVSFCILIDNDCIITEENEEEKICFAEISEDCITEINTTNAEDDESEVICCAQENEIDFSDSVILDYEHEKSFQESWLDDVACVETVVSDDIVEDIVISTHVSPREVELLDCDESGIYSCDINELTGEVKSIHEETLPDDVSKIVQTHHIDVNIMLYDKKTQDTELCKGLYMGECSEKNVSECNSRESFPSPNHIESMLVPDDSTNSKIPDDQGNLFFANIPMQDYVNCPGPNRGYDENYFSEELNQTGTSCNVTHDDGVDSYESSIDNVFNFKEHDEGIISTTSSSPEVSSTTSEEKSSSILLKITNYNGSRVSEVNEVSHNRPRCKFTEKKEYSNSYGSFPKRPLITKAAQKYIPPLKESIGDLKVKLSLPQQKLLKLKELKLTKNEPKVKNLSNSILMNPKKPKPNFEDVLKNIDKVQIKMHKEKSKKVRNIVPKVVIKKNVNGSHYTSSSNKDTFNPDLTGRKWQPWVFLEKDHFIDKMAIRNKKRAIFSHRKNTYVLAEKFKKYKSVGNSCSAKFVISQPKTAGSSKGQLKYTIRLKHTY